MTTRARPRALAVAALVVACAVQLYGLYAPTSPGPPMPPGTDKVVHLLLFAAVMVTGLLAGIRARPLAAVLAAHAVVSEVVQHALLTGRTGDPWDVVADLVGVAVGWWAVRLLRRRRDAAPAGTGRAR
jgi:VanZ family protein